MASLVVTPVQLSVKSICIFADILLKRAHKLSLTCSCYLLARLLLGSQSQVLRLRRKSSVIKPPIDQAEYNNYIIDV